LVNPSSLPCVHTIIVLALIVFALPRFFTPCSRLRPLKSHAGASSDEDDAGRGSTFSAKPKVQSSRQEYAIQPSVGVRKPKKRKKKKKNKLPEKLPVAGHHDHRRIAR
jgi:hypothetical protein